MSKNIMVKDDVYNIVKKMSGSRNTSIASMIEKALRFSYDVDETRGNSYKESSPEIFNLYQVIFGNDAIISLSLIKEIKDLILKNRNLEIELKQGKE